MSIATELNELALLRLLQLSDSQFPVGAFAHSGGLETYAHLDLPSEALAELLAHQICLGWGRLDLAAVVLAWQRAEDEEALEHLALDLGACKVIPGVHQTSLKLGRRMLKLADRLFPGRAPAVEPSHHAVILGSLGRRLDITLKPLLLGFAQSTLISALAAATRCMPVSPERAQEILIALQPQLSDAVTRVLRDPEGSFFSSTPALDLRAHQQAHLITRLFQS